MEETKEAIRALKEELEKMKISIVNVTSASSTEEVKEKMLEEKIDLLINGGSVKALHNNQPPRFEYQRLSFSRGRRSKFFPRGHQKYYFSPCFPNPYYQMPTYPYYQNMPVIQAPTSIEWKILLILQKKRPHNRRMSFQT